MLTRFFHHRAFKKSKQNYLAAKKLDRKFKVASVAFLVDASLELSIAYFHRVAEKLNVPLNAASLLMFNSNANETEKTPHHFNPKDISFFGKFGGDLAAFCAAPVDLMVVYTNENNFYMNWVAVEKPKKISVGFSATEQSINDIIFAFPPTEKETFESELVKYLNIIDKL